MCDTIRNTPKTCLAFKIFAAGRTSATPEQVNDIFEYVFGPIKPTDAVVVGMYPRFADQMVKENADLARKYGARESLPRHSRRDEFPYCLAGAVTQNHRLRFKGSSDNEACLFAW